MRPRLKRELVEGLDIMIVRELTGGIYFGEPKEIVTLENGEKRAVDTTVYTTREIERIAKVAFDLAASASQQGAFGRQAQRHAHRCAVERGRHRHAQGLRAEGRARAHPRRQLRHAARAQSEAVRRHRDRQPVRRHPVGRGRDDDRIARHAALGLARCPRSEDRQAARRSTSPCTARHPTSPARASPTRSRRIVELAWRCAIPSTWATKPTWSTRQSPACWTKGLRTGDIMQPGMTKVGTTEMGKAILDELEKLAA